MTPEERERWQRFVAGVQEDERLAYEREREKKIIRLAEHLEAQKRERMKQQIADHLEGLKREKYERTFAAIPESLKKPRFECGVPTQIDLPEALDAAGRIPLPLGGTDLALRFRFVDGSDSWELVDAVDRLPSGLLRYTAAYVGASGTYSSVALYDGSRMVVQLGETRQLFTGDTVCLQISPANPDARRPAGTLWRRS